MPAPQPPIGGHVAKSDDDSMFAAIFGAAANGQSAGAPPLWAQPVGISAPDGDRASTVGGDDEQPPESEAASEETGGGAHAAFVKPEVAEEPASARMTLGSPAPRSNAASSGAASVKVEDLPASSPPAAKGMAELRAAMQVADRSAAASSLQGRQGRLRRVQVATDVDAPPVRHEVLDMAQVANQPIHPMTILARMPAGDPFKALSRSRSTINSYTMKLSNPLWFDLQKPPTLTALARRWSDNAPKVLGLFDLDVQQAFLQLRERARSLPGVHDSIRKWLGTKKVCHLVDMLEPLQVLKKFLTHMKKTMAADFNLLEQYAIFYKEFETTGSVAAALKLLSPSDLRSWAAQGQLDVATIPKRTEDDDDEEEEEHVARSSKSPVTKVKQEEQDGNGKKRRKSKSEFLPLGKNFDLSLSGDLHAATLICEAIKLYFWRMKKESLADEAIVEAMVADLQLCIQIWEENWLPGQNAEDTSPTGVMTAQFYDMLVALECIARCARLEENLKPSASEVRTARRIAFDSKDFGGAAQELALSMTMYESLITLAEVSRVYSARGLEDQAATQVFNDATKLFEDEFEAAFADLTGWCDLGLGANGELLKRKADLSSAKGFLLSLHTAISRWSSVALQEHAEGVSDGVGNILSIVSSMSMSATCVFASRLHPVLCTFEIMARALWEYGGHIGLFGWLLQDLALPAVPVSGRLSAQCPGGYPIRASAD